jgi:hypothetical protein
MIMLVLCLGVAALLLLSRSDRKEPVFRELRIEGLEPRIAPAALTAKFGGGVLTIAGDPAAANVDIVETAGSIEVFDGMVSLGTFAGVKNITAKVQGGATVTANLADGGISGSFKMVATGVTTFALTAGSRIDGALTFNGDIAAQTFVVGNNVVVGKNLTFNGAQGADAFTIGAGSTIGGNATFAAIESGTFDTATVIAIGKNLAFKNTSTVLNVLIDSSGSAGVNISGAVTYAGGRGGDSLFLKATINGNAKFVDATGDNAFGISETSVVRGSVLMVTGSGNDVFNVQAGTIERDVTLKLGTGNNRFSYGIAGTVAIGGNLAMTTGDGNDQWQTSAGGMTLGGNLTMRLGEGTNSVIASAIVAGNKVSVKVGGGDDIVSIDGSATNAKLAISLGAGADTLAGALMRNSVSAVFDGGAGVDRFIENTLTGNPLLIVGFEDFS